MFTTAKKSKLLTRLSLEQDFTKPGNAPHFRNEASLTGRVIVMCFMTFYFGYCLAYLSTISQSILAVPFTEHIKDERVFGPCLGLIPLGAAVGVIIAQFTMNRFSRRYKSDKIGLI